MSSSAEASQRALRKLFRRALGVTAVAAVSLSPACQDDPAVEEVQVEDTAERDASPAADTGGEPQDTETPDTSTATDTQPGVDTSPTPDPLEALIAQCPELADSPPPEDMGAAGMLQSEGGDFIGLYAGIYNGPLEPSPPNPLAFSAGTACATATSNACQDTLAERQATSPRFVARTDGDTVVIATSSTFAETFGLTSIDRAAAYLWLRAGYNGGVLAIAEAGNGSYKAITTAWFDCPVSTIAYLVQVDANGVVTVIDEIYLEDSGGCVGRRPAGMVATLQGTLDVHTSVLGRSFAEMAYLEAAAVIAFENIAEELRGFGAPTALVTEALRAADDERRHALLTAALAERFGGFVRAPEVLPVPERSLEDFALDNAIEGCVRETFGALVGRYQGEHAEDDEIARTMRILGEDETRHASLSWQISAWLDGVLDEDARLRVLAAQGRAVELLRAAAGREPEPELCRHAGVPAAETSLRLFEALDATLWTLSG